MKLALEDGGFAPEEIGYINAHGTSTELNDKNETAAIKTIFGEAAYKIPVSSTKSMTGHMMGAAGSVEAVFCVQALQTDMLPPTMNYENPDPNCDLDYVPNQARSEKVEHIMSNSFGFGGVNSTLIFAQHDFVDEYCRETHYLISRHKTDTAAPLHPFADQETCRGRIDIENRSRRP